MKTKLPNLGNISEVTKQRAMWGWRYAKYFIWFVSIMSTVALWVGCYYLTLLFYSWRHTSTWNCWLLYTHEEQSSGLYSGCPTQNYTPNHKNILPPPLLINSFKTEAFLDTIPASSFHLAHFLSIEDYIYFLYSHTSNSVSIYLELCDCCVVPGAVLGAFYVWPYLIITIILWEWHFYPCFTEVKWCNEGPRSLQKVELRLRLLTPISLPPKCFYSLLCEVLPISLMFYLQ